MASSNKGNAVKGLTILAIVLVYLLVCFIIAVVKLVAFADKVERNYKDITGLAEQLQKTADAMPSTN